jgi:hypothetical protein
MPTRGASSAESNLRILAVTQGLWGERIAENIKAQAPPDWEVTAWAAPRVLPPVIDYPEEYLPETFAPADLVLALGDVSGLAQLIPDIAQMCSAKAVIAAIDRNASLPPGLVKQLERWLTDINVAVAFPKPFCSLSPRQYNRTPLVRENTNSIIARFAEFFGKPEFEITVENGKIESVEVQRDTACGCARYVAERLVGEKVDETIEAAGLLHHHFPCLADMNKDEHYHDTLMHVSGNLLKDSIRDSLNSHLADIYIRPHGRHEDRTKEDVQT